MQSLSRSIISTANFKALKNLKKLLADNFCVDKLIAFGSVVRNEADDESDLDLLVVTCEKLSRTERHKITDIIFDINLKYGTNISSTVVDKYSWERGYFSILPIKDEIEREGVVV